jgi:hypothetical protein
MGAGQGNISIAPGGKSRMSDKKIAELVNQLFPGGAGI